MDDFLGRADDDLLQRVRDVDGLEMAQRLDELALAGDVCRELQRHWDETRESVRWSSLLASLVAFVERGRGAIDQPLTVWADLNECGPSGRLLYYYLFALQVRELGAWFSQVGLPQDVWVATISALARHGETHRLKHGSVGVDAGWWMLPILRGEIVQVQNLKFHRVRLGLGPLSPRPWLDSDSAAALGEGFRVGDQSVGVHIPARVNLGDEALDATFSRARDVLGAVWPSETRRIATCQSWMMDERLVEALGIESRIVRFQRRFELIAPVENDSETVVSFVFGRNSVPWPELRATTRLQRAVLEVLARGEQWHNRTGWFEFD